MHPMTVFRVGAVAAILISNRNAYGAGLAYVANP